MIGVLGPYWKPALAGIGLVAMIAVTALGAWGALREIRSLVNDAAIRSSQERDAFWKGEIAAANAAAARAVAEQARQALAAEAAARDRISDLEDELDRLERDNAVLPAAADCGIGRDRVRLLNSPRAQGSRRAD